MAFRPSTVLVTGGAGFIGANFAHRAVGRGDEVTVYSELLGTGRTSMRFKVEAWRRSREGDSREKVTEAVFTFVAIDSGRRPRPVPQLSPS